MRRDDQARSQTGNYAERPSAIDEVEGKARHAAAGALAQIVDGREAPPSPFPSPLAGEGQEGGGVLLFGTFLGENKTNR